jgi:hypothetical protein
MDDDNSSVVTFNKKKVSKLINNYWLKLKRQIKIR